MSDSNESAFVYPEGIERLLPRHDVPAGGRSGYVIAGGVQIHYLEWGAGDAPAVVCLHGGGQTAYVYEELGAALAGRYHVLAPDLPGHGDSDIIPRIDRAALAASVRAALGEFGIERAVIVGASLGGMAGLALAADAPELAAGIVLVDVGHRLEREGVRRILEFMKAHESFGSLEEAAAAVGEFLPRRAKARVDNLRRNLRQRDDGRWIWKHAFGDILRARPDLSQGWPRLTDGLENDAAKVECPVLVLRGAASDVLSKDGADEIASIVADGRVEVVGAAGHQAVGDNPDSVTAHVEAFLSSIGW